jgi:hypothetical protein
MQLRCLCYWKLLDLYAISCGLWFMSLEITQELWFVTLWLWFVIPFGYDETGFTGATRDRMRSQKSSTFRGEHFSPSPVKQQNAVPSFFMAADEPRRATNSLSNFTACPLAMQQPVLDVHPLWLQLFRTDDGQGGGGGSVQGHVTNHTTPDSYGAQDHPAKSPRNVLLLLSAEERTGGVETVPSIRFAPSWPDTEPCSGNRDFSADVTRLVSPRQVRGRGVYGTRICVLQDLQVVGHVRFDPSIVYTVHKHCRFCCVTGKIPGPEMLKTSTDSGQLQYLGEIQ